MGVLTFLVSDAAKEWCSLGKVFLDEDILAALKADLAAVRLRDWLVADEGEFNQPFEPGEAQAFADKAVAWMQAHADWRFLTDVNEEYDDVYLAENDEGAAEYKEEFGGEVEPIYKKTGDAFGGADDEGDE